MSDTFRSVVILLGFAYMVANYKRHSPEAPETTLPYDDLVDVRRYHHDGSQPIRERLGNMMPPTVPWEGVTEIM